MAPKGKSKKDKDSTTGKKKKAKPGLDGQKQKKSAKAASSKKKAWGKDKGKHEDDAENEGGGRALKPVRIKLDQEGRDAILDILHQLHVDGAEDGAKDDDDDSEDDEEEEEEGEEEEDNSTNGDDSGEEEDGSDAVEIDDSDGDGDVGFPATQGHGDFEYDGTFGDMANLMSDLVVNETALPTDATNGGETKARDHHGGSPTPSKKLPGSDEPGAGSRSEQGRSTRKKDIQASASSGKAPQQGLVENTLLGGSGSTGKSTSSAKKALRSNVTREKLLASMVQEDRKHSKQERPGTGGVPSAAIVAASTVGGGPIGGGSGGYRRPDPPGAGPGNDKVRLEVCAEKKKTGGPDLNGKKLMVFSRREPIQKVLDTCRGKLHMKKKAEGAALLEGEEVVDWLSDLSWVPNGAVVLISCNGAPGSKKGGPPPRTQGSAASATLDAAVDGETPAIVGEGEGPEQAEKDVEEDEEEALALAALSRIRESYKMRTRGRRSETGRVGTGESAEEAGKRMAEARRAKEGTAQFRKMMAQRQSLPAYSQREDIVRTIHDNQVVVLSGETGCGKTTQVPQFVLDGLIDQGQGGGCNIVCTQPRRISAVGVADRVASERCESVGGTVGYQIRLDSRVGPSTRLTFCTTGILLRRLTSDGMLAGVSHIMVDEVHERDLQTDFLLSILRDLLPKRPDLRVVLMSATLQADLFTKYFNSCPAITIPGRTFPVEITYLDSVNRVVRGPKAQTLMPRVSSGPEAATGRGNGSAHANSGGRNTGGRGSAEGGGGEDDAMSMAYDPLTGEPLESTGDRVAVSAMVSPKCEDKVDYDIMVDLIDHIMSTEDAASGRGGGGGGGGSSGSGGTGGRGNSNDKGRTGSRGNAGRQGQRRDGGQSNCSRGAAEAAVGVGDGEPLGAILVFLPGFAEIDQLVRALERHPRIGRGSRVFPLHSSLPPQQQKSIFQRMPPGVRKIVVSTNIAETSVTIDDCTHVIDAGRVREMRYDPITRMSCLLEVWISKASGSQRAGRAGRVRPGKCWRLYPQAFHETNMPTHTLAEMLRTPLEELVLQVLLLELGSPAEFLARAVEPPPPKMLRAALRNLYDLQAIVISKSSPILTPLGYHLAQLPMDARVGKLLLVAATLQCLDPILTIAAALSDKAPFQRPFGEQGRADAARQQFAQHKSDHLAIVDAFSAWRNKRRTCSYSEVRRWCREMFLSPATLERLDSIRQQFRQQLCEVGFAVPVVPNNRASGRDAAAAAGGGGGGGFGADTNNWRNKKGEEIRTTAASEQGGGPTPQDSDRNAGNIALVQSVLVAGLYPHVAAFRRPNSKLKMRKGHFITRDDVEPAFVHPSSVNHQRFSGAAESGRQVWIVYHSKMKTKQVYLQDSTYATPFSLMLWGARVRHERPLGKKHAVEVVIDRWLRFRMTESTAVAFKAMRRELSNLLVRKIEAPHEDTGPLSGLLVSCLGRLLEIESRNPYNT